MIAIFTRNRLRLLHLHLRFWVYIRVALWRTLRLDLLLLLGQDISQFLQTPAKGGIYDDSLARIEVSIRLFGSSYGALFGIWEYNANTVHVRETFW